MKKIKNIAALLLCIAAVLWLIPTVFVQSTISQIKSFELTESGENHDIYHITYTYQRDGKTYEATYKDSYGKDYIPMIGEQGSCYYITLPPYPAFNGDAPSPVPPLLLLALSAIVYVGKRPKFLSKKEKSDEQKS